MEISDIGSSNTDALFCHTNRPADGDTSGGHWFAPDGDRVEPGSNAVPGFVRNRVPMLVRLIRNSGTPNEGMYWCDVNDAAETPQTVYAGLYNTGRGIRIFVCKNSHMAQISFLKNMGALIGVCKSHCVYKN